MTNPKIKTELDKADITLRLYTIRNIANLAAVCPENKAEAYVLQDVVDHIACMVNTLIEEIGA